MGSMKKSVIFIFIILSGCDSGEFLEKIGLKEKIVNILQERNGLVYVPNTTEPFSGKYETYYLNTQKKQEIHYINGLYNGLQKGWYENGQLAFEMNYNFGKLDGRQRIWNENGQIIDVNYEDGERLYEDAELTDISALYDFFEIKKGIEETVEEVLHQEATSSSFFKLGKNKISSVWFEQNFQNESSVLRVYFVKTETLDNNTEEVIGCHSCGPSIGAITYRLKNNNWKKLSIQPEIIDSLGSWGKAPDIKKAEMIRLSSDKNVFLMPGSFSGQGYTENFKTLFLFSNNSWVEIGTLEVGEDNKGTCGRENGLGPCWSYDSQILVLDNHNAYPDLLVKKTGTKADEKGRVIPAIDIIYFFEGKKYVAKNNP